MKWRLAMSPYRRRRHIRIDRRQHIGDLRRQAVAHADITAGQIYLCAWRNLYHDVAFNTDITRCSARSLTNASIRSLMLFATSISIKLERDLAAVAVTTCWPVIEHHSTGLTNCMLKRRPAQDFDGHAQSSSGTRS
jgi:hypothetical protein